MPTTVTMMMFVVVDKHVVDGHLHVDAGALFLPRLAHNIFHWGSLVFIIFIFFSHNIFHCRLGSLVFIISIYVNTVDRAGLDKLFQNKTENSQKQLVK